MVVAAVLLVGILVLTVGNALAMVLSVAVVVGALLVLMVGVSRIPLLRNLSRADRN